MPKFQSTRNPNEIIEVNEEKAAILRKPVQDGWKEIFEEPPKKEETVSQPAKKKAGRPRKA